MADLVGTSPGELRGQIGYWRRKCTPESSAAIERWTGSNAPAAYEVEMKSGPVVLLSSRASRIKDLSCRLVQAERLKKWI